MSRARRGRRKSPRSRRLRPAAGVVLLAALAAAGAAAAEDGAAGGDTAAAPDRLALTLDELRTFTDVFGLLQRNYVDPVDESELLEAALRGMVRSLDPNSAYLGPEEYRRQEDSARGRAAGIGADVRVDAGRLRVAAVTPGGPAASAGMVPGELIVAIDGRPVRGRPLQDSLAGLRGAAGTLLRLRVQARDGRRRTVVMERAYAPVPSVSGALLEDRYAYLALSHFHDGSAAELRSTLERLAGETRTAEGLAGIILDLRGNRGGVIRGAVDIADGFLDEGLVLQVRGRSEGSRLEYRAEPGQWAAGVPLAVLVDGASASASEIVAGALQDHGRATVLGQTSFGKGTVQSVLPLRNGGALKLTTARYYTPSGESFAGRGIEPDLPLPVTAGDGDVGAGSPESDAVIAAALDLLRRTGKRN